MHWWGEGRGLWLQSFYVIIIKSFIISTVKRNLILTESKALRLLERALCLHFSWDIRAQTREWKHQHPGTKRRLCSRLICSGLSSFLFVSIVMSGVEQCLVPTNGTELLLVQEKTQMSLWRAVAQTSAFPVAKTEAVYSDAANWCF